MTAMIVDGNGQWLPLKKNSAFLERYSSARERRKLFGGKPSGVGGTLWEREAARDMQAHGEPVEPLRVGSALLDLVLKITTPEQNRAKVAEQIERRRPAMRATRAELDALKGVS